jgi:hypothetical protein
MNLKAKKHANEGKLSLDEFKALAKETNTKVSMEKVMGGTDTDTASPRPPLIIIVRRP